MPPQTVDYDAIAKKFNGVPQGQKQPSANVDYAKLAQKFGGAAVISQPNKNQIQPGTQPSGQANPLYVIGNNIRGMKARGNININNRPIVPNGKDSSTVLSMSIGTDEGEVLIPMVSDGADGKPPHLMGKDEAIQYYRKTKQHLGIFDNPADATSYAQQLHLQQAGLRNVNGRTAPVDHMALAAKHGGIVIRAHDPSLLERGRTAFESSYQGRTIENNVAQLGRGIKRLWSLSKNPVGMTDEAWQQFSDKQHNFFTKMFDKAQKSQWMPKRTPESVKKLSQNVYKAEAGAYEGAAQFGEEMLSPRQLALMAGTFGESALARAAQKVGLPGLVPAARTLSKLTQLEFLTQMVEGTAKNAEDAAKSAFKGDWQAASQNAVQGLMSLVMAKTLVSHESAQFEVQTKLNHAAGEMFPEVEPKGLQRPFASAFDRLDPFKQGQVIDKVVRETPEYQSSLDSLEHQNEETREGIKKQHAAQLNDFYARAVSESWDPNAASRTIRKLQGGRERLAKMDQEKRVQDQIDAVRTQYEETRKQARDARFQRRQETAVQRTQSAAEVGRVAANLAEKRDDIWKQRNELREAQAPTEGIRREVETRVDDRGNVTYPVEYFGEENVFGVAGDLSGHSIFRQTPRGTEWLDANGNFEEEPEDLYAAPDPQTADTLARLTTLSVRADEVADGPSPTAEQTSEAEELAAVRRELLAGEISTRDAQRRAGIAEEVKLPDEYAAAAEGKLNGPFREGGLAKYQDSLRREAEAMDFPEEATNRLVEEAGMLARQQTEDVLNHVYRAGDYIVGRSGSRWTLDSKGMLHSDSGEAVPLMKRGVYSSQAVELAQSGRIGYGVETRDERRARSARERKVAADIAAHQAEVDWEMRLAAHQAGLEMMPEAAPRVDAAAKGQREARRLSTPPRTPESGVGAIVRQVFKARSDESGIINAIANRGGTTPENVMRLALANDPERSQTVEGKIARLEPGDTISDPFRKDRPWVVVDRGNGEVMLRSGNASPLPLDRVNPSERVRRLVQEGQVDYQKPEFAPADVVRAAFEKPHYLDYQDRLARDVAENKPLPKPVTARQTKAVAEVAQRRAAATVAVATRAAVEALDPPPQTTVEEAVKAVDAAEQEINLAEKATTRAIHADVATLPADVFSPRAPATIGLRGKDGVISQNGREFPFHYELLPLNGVFTSHKWEGNRMVPEPTYDSELQPRTVSDGEAAQNALRAEVRRKDESGRIVGYNFAEYTDPTISGAMGPAIVEGGGRAVGGNTRIAIMRRHLDNLRAISDPEEREAYLNGFRGAMHTLADNVGIPNYPRDGQDYVVVRMLDAPIKTTREAAELGRLFNKSVSVQIGESARGVSYSKSLDPAVMQDIARRTEASDGIGPAMQADPEFFRDIIVNRFGIVPEEYVNWFDETDKGLVLNESGRSQFEKALLGTAISDAAVLNRMEGKTAYRAVSRALGYFIQMHAVPERDISGKIVEALNAAADTLDTDPQLSLSRDKWLATYHPDQVEFAGMETERPPEPDRVAEALWRAMHASSAGTPRVLNDKLKRFMEDTSSAGAQLFGGNGVETPADAFNRAFARELREVQHARGDQHEGITEEEFKNALRNREMSDVEREESRKEPETPEIPVRADVEKPKGLTPPPKAPTKESVAGRDLAISKAETGYVSPDKLQEFLSAHPATKEHVPELMRTAKIMAEYVYDVDPPEGVARKDALDWVLRERLAAIESGELKSKAGQYADPNIEKGWGDRIMKLHQAATPSTFIHEFAHVIFPMLGDEDLKAIDTIAHKRGEGGVWDGTRQGLTGETYAKLSEKFAHGLEQFLRDENPTGFTHEVKQVLAKVKEIMRKVYMAFAGDPLSEFANTEESREVFSKMFGITDFDVQDNWRDEVKQARAEEKRLKRPSEEAHPVTKMATEVGATSVQNNMAGKVEDSIGARVDPRKPTAAFIFPDQAAALAAWDRVSGGAAKVENAELVQSEDGTWGIRFNTRAKLPSNILYQEVPRRHPALELEDLKKQLRETPESAPMLRKLLGLKVQNLENEIRSRFGSPAEAVEDTAPAAKDALQEVRGGKTTDAVRETTHGNARISPPERTGGLSKPPTAAKSANAGTGPARRMGPDGSRVAGVPNSLSEVKAVSLEPLNAARGTPVGTVKGDAFGAHEWVDGLRRAGLPENLPPPTWALDRRTAEKLIFPGQKQVVQTALSTLEVADGMVVATATGTGKSFVATGITKEWRYAHPDARVLHITKNAGLLKDAQRISANTFGFDIEDKVPDSDAKPGVYGTTYARIIRDPAVKNTKWDLVIADESGEARRWYDEQNKQGKALMDITANSKKAVYFSATPFHNGMEYGYLNKLGLWPKNGFDRWIENNFAHEKIDGKVIARLDPGKQAKLRQQLIERGQLVSQAISYEGFTAHFGVVPVTDSMKRGLDRIHEGFARAKKALVDMKKKGLAEKIAAFEATYTKAFLERERLPQAIQLARRARENGWQVILFSETSSEDLFRRDIGPNEEPSTYQQLDTAMGGQLARIIPAFPDVYDQLQSEFGTEIVDFSGRGNSMAERERAKSDFLAGEAPMLYTTYAAGGIGVSLHDADYPDRGIKGGDKPRVAIFLGPPYSGVLLEQAMGRSWRFGVKSDTHAVFLATDSEPDVRLMQTKVGPRMRALRASVLGEKDSLASVMASYSDEEKVLARQQSLAYQEGNEENIDPRNFQVRSRSRTVGINDWSQINFPPASTAKNKGMRYGDAVTGGGDWSNLYQAKFGLQPPETPETIAAGNTVDAIGNGLATGVGVPVGQSVNVLDPADRDAVVGAASAAATVTSQTPVERDTGASARQSMQSQMKLPGDKLKWVLTYPEKGRAVGVWKYTGDPTEIPRSLETGNPEDRPKNDMRTWYGGMVFTQEQGIRSIAKQAGTPEVGAEINRIQRGYTTDRDVHFADFAIELHKIFTDAGIRDRDARLMNEVWDVKEGHAASDNPKVNRAVDGLTKWFDRIHDAEAEAGVKLKTPGGELLTYHQIGKDPNYMPHRIDWEAKVQDPMTGEVHTLRDVMKETFAEASRRRIIDAIAQERGYSYDQVVDYLKAYAPNTPVLGHIHRARTINFPFIRKDWKTLNSYALQAADAIAIAKNFGQDREILDKEIAKIPSENGRRTISNMFDGLLEPQEWNDWTARAYNAAIAFEAATKMTISAAKVPYHALLIPFGLKGRIRPVIHAGIRMGLHPRETMENAAYVGAIAHQLNAADVIAERDSQGITHEIFKKTAFNAFYKLVRTLAAESSRVWMEQYAMHELTRGNSVEARRMLRDVMLIGDQAIDQAVANGRFAPEDLKRGETAFTNLTTWSNSPLQMPGWARLHMERNESTSSVALKRAVRLTYALQSFSLKATSLLREQLWDEVMKHNNYKPLAYALVAMPVIGQMLSGTSAGVSAFVHRGVEGLEGKKHTEDDRWDRWLKEQLDAFHNPDAVKFLKWYIDGLTLGVGWDRVRRYADLSLNIIEGKRKGALLQDAKNARKQARSALNYLKDDEIEEFLGPAWGEILHMYEAGKQVGTIALGERGTTAAKEKKEKAAGERYLNEVVPITKQIPQLTPPPKASASR